MFKNYFAVALRNLYRSKMYSLINVFGLAVGIACCAFILIFIQYEYSYDRYHEKYERIFRLIEVGKRNWACLPAPIATELSEDFPDILSVRFLPRINNELSYENVQFYEDILFADPNVFKVFSFKYILGDPGSALQEPFSIVITETAAKRYFGTANPLDRIFRYNNKHDLKVTGVLKDIPQNSHFKFDFLCSFSSLEDLMSDFVNMRSGHNFYTYILFPEPYSLDRFSSQLPDFTKNYNAKTNAGQGTIQNLELQPLKDIHLHSNLEKEIEMNGNMSSIYIFSITAAFILIIACFNFMNLATARSVKRAKEVGIRKAIGAYRLQLIKQFLGESIFLTLISFVFALMLIEIFSTSFQNLLHQQFDLNFTHVLIMLAITLLTGIFSGSYSAFYLSAFLPGEVLKGRLITRSSNSMFRKCLVVSQFSISILLIIAIGIVSDQLHYVRSTKLGYNKENVVVISTPKLDRNSYESLKQEFFTHSSIVNVSGSDKVPNIRVGSTGIRLHTGAIEDEGFFSTRYINVEYDFLKTFEIQLIDGRDFSPDFSTDVDHSFLVNEEFIRRLGVAPLGTELETRWGKRGTIIGVFKDFNYASLHRQIEPLCLGLNTRGIPYISVRIRPKNISETMDFLESKWQELNPHTPWEYSFLDESFDKLYRSESTLQRTLGIFSLLGIFITCLGLFGLCVFSAEQRLKEIGIRKILGASVSNLVLLLSKEFMLLVIAANAIAWPIAYFIMDRWLQNFAYRVDMNASIFILGGLLTLLIAQSTIIFHAIKAAQINPVDSLRNE